MDDTDEALIAELRKDARRPIASLAAVLGLSRATVRSRMARLEARGEIVGYTAVLRGDAPVPGVRAIMMLAIEGKAMERVLRALQRVSEIRAIHTTNGRWDLVIELGADTLERFDAALGRVRLVEGVSATETSLLLSTRKSART
jgi:DNA-binding Lrp family transcriptional regulator